MSRWCTAIRHSCPWGAGRGASRGLIGGTALCLVLHEAQQHLALLVPSPRLPGGGSRFQDRQVRSRHHPEHHVAFAQLAAAAYNSAQLPPGVALGLDFSRRNTLGTSPYAFATHVAVVEVSQETGAIRVLKYVAVHDAGRMMNPLLAAGQVHGGIAQGIGQACWKVWSIVLRGSR